MYGVTMKTTRHVD